MGVERAMWELNGSGVEVERVEVNGPFFRAGAVHGPPGCTQFSN